MNRLKYRTILGRLKSWSIFQFTLLLLIFTAIVSIGLVTIAWIYTEKASVNNRIKELSAGTLNRQKEGLKNEVERVFNYIEYLNNNSSDLPIEELQENVLNYFKNMRFGNDGYIFINTYEGFALLFDGEKIVGEKAISNLTDPQGLKIFERELELAKMPDGGYFQYLFKKLNDTVPVPKISYIKGYDNWQWIIGTGDYLDNFDSEIMAVEEEYQSYLISAYLKVFVISFIVFLVLLAIGSFVAKKTQRQFNRLINLINPVGRDGNTDTNIEQFYIRELRTISQDIFNSKELIKNFGDIIEHSRNEIFIFGLKDLKFIHANQGALENSGYSLSELQQLNPHDLSPEKDRKHISDLLNKLKSGESEHVRLETTLLRSNGSYYPIEANITTTDFYQEPVFVAFIQDISKRKEAEENLLSTMHRYSGLFDNAPISLWEEDYTELIIYLDEQKKIYNLSIESVLEKHPELLINCVEKIRVIDVNKQALILYEAATKEELIGNLGKTFTDDSFAAFKKIVLALYNGDSQFEGETKNITLKGRQIDILLKLSLLTEDSRLPRRAILSITDITELRAAEIDLKASEASFRSLFQNNHTVMLMIDPGNGRFLDVNPAALKFYGYSLKEFKEELYVYDINLQSEEEVLYNLAKALNQDSSYFNFQHRLADGDIRDVELYSGPLQYGKSKVLFSLVHDVTDKIKDRRAIKEAKEKLESIFRAAPTGIGVVSDRIFTEVNQLFCKMVGYSEDEIIGRESRFIYPSEKEFERVGKLKYSQILKSGTGSIETKFIRKDGELIDILLSSTPLVLNDFSKGVTFTALDITERKKAEKELLSALKRATESDRLKSSFLATMSHELRTPLNAIIGFSDLMGEDIDIKDSASYASIINTSGKHLLRLVEDVMNITLIEAGESKLLLDNCSVSKVLSEVYDIIIQEQKFQNKMGIELIMEIPQEDRDLSLSTDASKVKQILINLLKNALKFTPGGQIRFGYLLVSEKKKRVVKFFVKDSGIGIAKDKRQVIFEMFRQADESLSRSFGGAGIGLSISKKLVAILGGELWFDSVPGKGSDFYFTIPYSPEK